MAPIIWIALFIAIIIVAIEIFFVRWIWKKESIGKIIAASSLLILTWLTWSVYSAVYPPDCFYEKEFKKVTGIDFPRSGKVVLKDASYPDQHGDYSSCALIDLSAEDYNSLLQMISKQSYQGRNGSASFDNVLKQLGDIKFIAEASSEKQNEYFYWALIEERYSVLIHYASW